MFTPGGRSIHISQKKNCAKCRATVEHVCYSMKYTAGESDPNIFVRKSRWACSSCGLEHEESVEVQPLSDKARIIQRIIRMQDDYPIEAMRIVSQPNSVIVEFRI